MANFVATGLGVSLVPAAVAQIHVAGVTYRPVRLPAPVARLALATRLDDSAVVRQFVVTVGEVSVG